MDEGTNQRVEERCRGPENQSPQQLAKRQRADELRRHLAELARADRLSTAASILSELAHELSQPLSAIGNYAEACSRVMQSGVPSSHDDVGRWMMQIGREVDRTAEIIRRMNRLVPKVPLRATTVDLNALVEGAIELMEVDARRHRVEIRFLPAEGLPGVPADRGQLEQVMVHLIGNAFEAMQGTDPGRRQLAIETSMNRENGIRVALRDTGEGIAPDAIDRVFDPFFTTRENAIGMGLAVCRSIVEAHGGRLGLTCNPERGTTFYFTIPTSRHEHREQ